jgi:DNA (cytosine-5)-methyltransferase 1
LPPDRDTPRVLSLFTGAGGLDLGLEAAGFEVAGCVERDADCRQTIANNTDWRLAADGDVERLTDAVALLSEFDLKPEEVDLLAGGPPCQPFSKSGQWARGEAPGMSDPRAVTLRKYFEIAEAALPRVMLLENVKGIAAAPKSGSIEKQALDVLSEALAGINDRHGTAYKPAVLHLEAADFGVPQRRERVFVVAARDGVELALPVATHGDRAPARDAARRANVWDAIGDLDSEDWDASLAPTGRWADLLASIPEGSNYLWHTDRRDGLPLFGWRRKYWSFLLKLAKDRPSWTIQATPGPATGPFHWRSRRLSVLEAARLQTFPDAHRFAGGTRSAHKQIGNAVPVGLAELLGRHILHHLLDRPEVDLALTTIPKRRSDAPPAEPVGEVPAKYLDVDEERTPHPGHGHGPRALQLKEQQEALERQREGVTV